MRVKLVFGVASVVVGCLLALVFARKECEKTVNNSFPDGDWIRCKNIA